MIVQLTQPEAQLLRELIEYTAELIAAPQYTVEGWRLRGGGNGSPTSTTEPGSGFRCQLSDKGAITAQWHHAHVVARFPNPNPPRPNLAGKPARYQFDQPHKQVRLTHKRCIFWAQSLPEWLRYQAVHQACAARHSATHARTFTTIAVHALDITPVKALPQPRPVQLDLFGAPA